MTLQPNWTVEQNARARAFWRSEAQQLRSRVELEILRQIALRNMCRFARVAEMPSLEQALAEVEADAILLGPYIRSSNARRMAAARKPDALQALIVSLVRRRPELSCSELLDMLGSGRYPNVIEEVLDGEIHFRHKVGGRHDVSKSVKISALKDRLSRAKKSVRPKR